MKKLFQKLPIFLFELLIVFIGVYAAFSLNTWQEANKAKQSRIKYYEGFVAELKGISNQAKKLQIELDTFVVTLKDQIKKGKRPDLPPMPELDFTVNAFITKSAFNSTHFENMDVNYLVSISNGSNLFDMIKTRIERFHRSARKHLYISNPSFYTPFGTVKKEYTWYLEDLDYIRRWLGILVRAIDEGAVPETNQQIEILKN